MKSHGSGQEVSEKKLGTFTRLLIPTEDQKNGAEGVFLVFIVLAATPSITFKFWLQPVAASHTAAAGAGLR